MTDAVLQAGAATIARRSRSFALAARLFDRPTREAVLLIYAWCRLCDDLVDEPGAGAPVFPSALIADARLAAFEAATRAVLAGAPAPHPAFAGLARTVGRYRIPPRYLAAHLDGFRMDARGRTYATVEELLDYCYHVAGVVGLMVAHVMGVRDPATLDRACDLGIAFQLTNIARDIVADAAAGRVYVPDAWLEDAGLSASTLADPSRRRELAAVAARLVAVAEPYYGSALAGVARLPFRSAWAVRTALFAYRQIGVEVCRRGSRAWDGRVTVGRWRQAAILAREAFAASAAPVPAPPPARPVNLWCRPG